MERDSLGNMIVRFCPDKPCTGPGHVHSLILPWHQGFRATPTGVESVEETVIAREKLECMLADAYEAGQAKLPERIEKKLFTFTIDFEEGLLRQANADPRIIAHVHAAVIQRLNDAIEEVIRADPRP